MQSISTHDSGRSSPRGGPGRARAVGVDVGGTKVLGVRVAWDGEAVEIEQRIHLPVARSAGGSVAMQVTDVVSALSLEHPGAPVGVGVAGYIGLDGIARRSPNLPSVVRVDLASELRDKLGASAVVDNDANCVALAAQVLHRSHPGDLVAVTFGTGIGGGLVLGERLVRGARGFAGEPGHMVVQRDGIPCVCGQRGCWERYASGSRLSELAALAIDEGRIAVPVNAPEGLPGAPMRAGEVLVDAARRGDEAAQGVIEEFAGWVALGFANIINLVDPGLIVVGGGLSSALDVLVGPVTRQLETYPTIAGTVPEIDSAPMAEASGAIGAALMALGA